MPAGFPFWNFVVDSAGNAIAGASIAVIPFGGNISVFPGSPLATIFSDPALTLPISQPFTSDTLGRFVFWAPPGAYYIQVYGAVTPYVIPVNVGQIQSPTLSSLGGVFQYNAVAHQFLTSLDNTGTFHSAQPAFTDISGVATVGQIGTGTPAANKYVDGGTGAWTTLPSVAAVVNSHVRTTLGSDVALTALTTATLITKAITMPSSGGPWRVLVQQAVMYLSTAGTTLDSWVEDGLGNSMASGQDWVSGTGAPGTDGTEFSPVTYANSAVVTFTLKCQSGTTATAKTVAQIGNGTGTYLSLSVMSSN